MIVADKNIKFGTLTSLTVLCDKALELLQEIYDAEEDKEYFPSSLAENLISVAPNNISFSIELYMINMAACSIYLHGVEIRDGKFYIPEHERSVVESAVLVDIHRPHTYIIEMIFLELHQGYDAEDKYYMIHLLKHELGISIDKETLHACINVLNLINEFIDSSRRRVNYFGDNVLYTNAADYIDRVFNRIYNKRSTPVVDKIAFIAVMHSIKLYALTNNKINTTVFGYIPLITKVLCNYKKAKKLFNKYGMKAACVNDIISDTIIWK